MVRTNLDDARTHIHESDFVAAMSPSQQGLDIEKKIIIQEISYFP